MSSPSQRLERSIRRAGPIPFAEFMDHALYGEGGYYNRPRLAIGPQGDFVTGSSYSDLFGHATGRLLERLDHALGCPATMLEVGYGEGRHLKSVAASVGAGRPLLAWDRIARPLPDGVRHLDSLDEVAEGIDGLIFSYELFDALPVHRLIGRQDGSVGELFVGMGQADEFDWVESPLSSSSLANLLGDVELEVGQIADVSPSWSPLYSRLASRLGRGLMVTIDYGYPRDQLLDVRVRRHGTAAAYRSHRVHRGLLQNVGEQDLTAHVDFTALQQAGEDEGLETWAFTRQARWLLALGLFEGLEEADLATRHEAATLLDPEGMGDQMRVLVQGRGIDLDSCLDRTLLS